MLTVEALDKVIQLLEEGSTFFSITTQTGLTRKEAETVAHAYDVGNTVQLYREVGLAGILELAASTLRSGAGLDEGATANVLCEIIQVYPEQTTILANSARTLSASCY